MKKYFRRGKFSNSTILVRLDGSHKSWIDLLQSSPAGGIFDTAPHALQYNDASWFVKTLIVRGIGYRAFSQKNDFAELEGLSVDFLNQLRPFYSYIDEECSEELDITKAVNYEFTSSRYLIVRAGHTVDLCAPLHPWSMTVTKKKDRKLIVAGLSPNVSGAVAKRVHSYRPPSAYTGRGARIKHAKPVRKAGKKDKQKGKIF